MNDDSRRKLIDSSPFTSVEQSKMTFASDIDWKTWPVKDTIDIGYPMISAKQSIRVIVVYQKEMRLARLDAFSPDWQLVVLGKLLALSRLDALPTNASDKMDLIIVLRTYAKKLMAAVDNQSLSQDAIVRRAHSFLSYHLADKFMPDKTQEMAWFTEWRKITSPPKNDMSTTTTETATTVSTSAGNNEPSTKRRRVGSVGGSVKYQNADHPFMSGVIENFTTTLKSIDAYVTENENLHHIIAEKDKGIAESRSELEMLKKALDAQKKSFKEMSEYCEPLLALSKMLKDKQ